MEESLFSRVMEASAKQDAEAIRALHHDDFFCVWETEMAHLDEHLEWVAKEVERTAVTDVECLFEDKVCLIMKNTRKDDVPLYAICLKRDGLFYRGIFNTNKPHISRFTDSA